MIHIQKAEFTLPAIKIGCNILLKTLAARGTALYKSCDRCTMLPKFGCKVSKKFLIIKMFSYFCSQKKLLHILNSCFTLIYPYAARDYSYAHFFFVFA